MDFFTTNNSPIPITINGTAYQLPRFLNPAFLQWGAQVRKEIEDDRTKGMDADSRARFLIYFYPIVDVVHLSRLASTPEGSKYIVDYSMKAAGISDDIRRAVWEQSTPGAFDALAAQLLQPEKILATQGAAKAPDPLPSTPAASVESPATGPSTSTDSAPPSQESTPPN